MHGLACRSRGALKRRLIKKNVYSFSNNVYFFRDEAISGRSKSHGATVPLFFSCKIFHSHPTAEGMKKLSTRGRAKSGLLSFSAGRTRRTGEGKGYPRKDSRATRRKARPRIFSPGGFQVRESGISRNAKYRSRSRASIAIEDRTVNKFLLSLRELGGYRSPIFPHFEIVEADNVTPSRYGNAARSS